MENIKKIVAELNAFGEEYRRITELINKKTDELKQECEAHKQDIIDAGRKILINEDEDRWMFCVVTETPHYRVKPERVKDFIKFLRENGVSPEDLSDEMIEDDANLYFSSVVRMSPQIESMAEVTYTEEVEFEVQEKPKSDSKEERED